MAHRASIYLDFDGASLRPGPHGPAGEASCLDSTVEYPGFIGPQEEIDAIVAMVRDKLAPYDVRVFDAPPPEELPYVTAMIGGVAPQLGLSEGTNGYTCEIDCGDPRPDDLVFVFDRSNSFWQPPEKTASVALHEIGHSWGLDHEAGGTIMSPFDATEQWSTECTPLSDATSPVVCVAEHESFCGEGSFAQNSDAELMALFGPRRDDTTAPELAIVAPIDGAELPAGASFAWTIETTDDAPGFGWSFSIVELDWKQIARDGEMELDVTLPPGTYTLAVDAIDPDLNAAHAEIRVEVVVESAPDTTTTTDTDESTSGDATTGAPADSSGDAPQEHEGSSGCAIGGATPLVLFAALLATRARRVAALLTLVCSCNDAPAPPAFGESSGGSDVDDDTSGADSSSTSGPPERPPTDAVCGNGIREGGEDCDLGIANTGAACRSDCTAPRCGDGIVDPDELCDGPPPDCTAACRPLDEPAWEIAWDVGFAAADEIVAVGSARGLVFVAGTSTVNFLESTPFVAAVTPHEDVDWAIAIPLAGRTNEATDLLVLDDGGIVTGSMFADEGGNFDVWALRFRDDGTIVWERSYDGIESFDDYGGSITRWSADTVLLGTSRGLPLGRHDAEMIVVDVADGSERSRHLLGDGTQGRAPADAVALADGRVAVAGVRYAGRSWGDGWVAMLDADLGLTWEHSFEAVAYAANELLAVTTVDPDRIVVVGAQQDGTSNDAVGGPNYDVLVATSDTEGTRWTSYLEAGTGGREDWASAVLADETGGWIALGRVHTMALLQSTDFDVDAWARRFDASGRPLEGFTHDGATHLFDAINAATWLDATEMLVAGTTQRTATLGDAWVAVYVW